MQNFGRGMWRRLNDYQTIQNINQTNIKNNQLQEYLAYKEFCKKREEINAYRQKILLEKCLERKEEERKEQEEEKIQSGILKTLGNDNEIINNIIFVESLLEEKIEEKLEEKIEEKLEEKIEEKVEIEEKNVITIVPKKLKKKNKKKC